MTAKRIILSVLAAAIEAPLSTSQLVQCGLLMDIDGAATRVALRRLIKNGDVHSPRRGHYAIGTKGQPILHAIHRWIDLPSHIKPWEGGWLLVHTAHLGRSDRAGLRRRERALALFGFGALVDGLWVRPDNLSLAFVDLRRQLVELGLEAGAVVASAGQIEHGQGDQELKLWDRRTLEAGYKAASRAMAKCLSAYKRASVEERARSTAQIGTAVIGMLSFDPLLPGELVNAQARDQVHAEMLRFNEVGKEAMADYWRAAAG